MITSGRRAFALYRGRLRKWDFGGWGGGPVELGADARLLTPATTVAVLRQGFLPIWHPSIDV
jgi:hypothetical protein